MAAFRLKQGEPVQDWGKDIGPGVQTEHFHGLEEGRMTVIQPVSGLLKETEDVVPKSSATNLGVCSIQEQPMVMQERHCCSGCN